jgi:hypothetical protein
VSELCGLISLQICTAIKALLRDIAESKLIQPHKHSKTNKSKYFARLSTTISNPLSSFGQLGELDPGHLS